MLRRKLHALAEIDPRLLVEDKLHSVAVHYRLALQREDFLKQEVTAIVAADHASEVESLFGKAVIEIKPKHFNKGTAVTELMTCPPFAGRTPLFIGDDTTDEAVFAILPDLAGIWIFRRAERWPEPTGCSSLRTRFAPGSRDLPVTRAHAHE